VEHQQHDGEGFAAFGLIWKYDYSARLWRYKEFSIGYDPQRGYILNFPGGHETSLRYRKDAAMPRVRKLT